jgi:signal transduction histidine kinase
MALADINMPRMDGLTLLGRLQEADDPLATVVVSAYGDMGNIRTAMNRGAFDFLFKPIDFADLEATVAKTLRHVAALRQARAAAAELQRQREALLQAEKMAAFGSLLAGVAHELNNPLSIVLAGALMLQEDLEAAAPDLARGAERVRVAAERCTRIVRSFLAMARQQEARRRPVAPASLIDGALELLAYGLRSGGIEVAREVPADLPPLFGDADQLHQVLANLITNARQALEHRPEPRRLRVAAEAVGDAVEISVADNGPGIPAEVRERVFDPFFTTKPVGAGTGIGLAVSRGIAGIRFRRKRCRPARAPPSSWTTSRSWRACSRGCSPRSASAATWRRRDGRRSTCCPGATTTPSFATCACPTWTGRPSTAGWRRAERTCAGAPPSSPATR